MRFAEPSWLWVGAAACVALIALLAWNRRRRAQALARLVAARHFESLSASVSPLRRTTKHVLLVTGLACVFVALARPQWGYHLQEQHREGVALMFAVDTSKSMLAEDVRPSRLARARLAVEDLLAKMPNNPAGLVVFAGDAFLQTPLTLDRVAFRQALETLDTELIPVPGTDLQSAIRVAEQAFGVDSERRKILVLLTDGEDLEGSALTAARDAAERGVTIFTVGVGTEGGGPIPVRDARGAATLLRDSSGELVHSKLDDETLREMARITGGSYRALGQSGQGLEALYRDSLAQLPTESVEGRSIKVFHERFQWPLGLGIALLLIEWLLNEYRKRRVVARSPAAAALTALLLLGSAHVGRAHAQEGSAVTTYNQASAQYRAGDFDAAAEGYRAALDTRDLSLQQRAYYDLGNALYRQGQAAGDDATTRARYQSAIEAYEAALALKSDDADAAFNRDFVRRKLQALEQKQKQEQAKSDPQEQSDSSKQDERDQNQGSAQDDQGSSGEGEAQQGASSDSDGTTDGAGSDNPQEGEHGPQEGEQGAQGAQGEQTPNDPTKGDSQAPNDSAPGGEQKQDEAGVPAADAPERPDAEGQAAAGEPKQGSGPSAEAGDTAMAQTAADTGEPAVPGGLTRGQSARLLDALEGELRRLPSDLSKSNATRANEYSKKDW